MPGLQAQQIVTLACAIARVPNMLAFGGQMLNMILADLAQTQDMDLCRGKFTFNFTADSGNGNGAGPYPLPLDYYRHTNDGVFFTVNGVPYNLINITQAQYDALVITSGLENYPTVFTTDISPLTADPPSPPLMFVWQPANGAYPVTVRYYKYLPDIVSPETSTSVPWFPNQQYLIDQLSVQMMKIADDDRVQGMSGLAQGELLKFMQMQAQDNEGRPNTVGLDRRKFGYSWDRLKDTKTVGFF